jgi:hypothetical protein
MITFTHVRGSDEVMRLLAEVKQILEDKVNLSMYTDDVKPVAIFQNTVQRLAFMAGLSLKTPRNVSDWEKIELGATTFHDSVFSKNNYLGLWSALLKLRHPNADWDNKLTRDKIINFEMLLGFNYLLKDDQLTNWIENEIKTSSSSSKGDIPALNIDLGAYEGDIPARLDLNSVSVLNTQILISGATGSGKTNLLAVLIHELRVASVETAFPVNFLLFDYKGEFSDPSNRHWLDYFEVSDSAILDPIKKPLPFNPFKDFLFKPENELNLYASELSSSLAAIDRATISANMTERLTKAVIEAYRKNKMGAVSFQRILDEYIALQNPKERDEIDSVKALLNTIIRSKLFAQEDQLDLIKNSLIVKMDGFPKDGPVAKAIVYFTMSKLNALYESLPVQSKNDKLVEIRHFSIIDEAHYMLDFDNRPLRNLIAVGRNKGLSVALATQNMDSFVSKHFDFYANAQYPLIMRQQSINDKVLKDFFGVSGQELNDLKEEIAGLQKGELLIKNPEAYTLGIGQKYKKIYVKKLI